MKENFRINGEARQKPTVSLIVSMWNQRLETLEMVKKLMLPGISQNLSSAVELILIDDGSPLKTQTADFITSVLPEFKRQAGEVIFITNGENLGIAASHNKGFRRAGGEIVVLSSTDAYLTKGSLEKMTTMLDFAGTVSPMTNSAWSPQRTRLFDGIRNYSDEERARIESFSNWLRQVAEGERHQIKGRSYPTGFCYAVRAEVLKEARYLDERFSGSMFEDTDFFRRVQQVFGLPVLIDMGTFVEHGGPRGSSVSLRQDQLKRTAAIARNGLNYFRKWRDLRMPIDMFGAMLHGLGYGTLDAKIIQRAKEKSLWNNYLKGKFSRNFQP